MPRYEKGFAKTAVKWIFSIFILWLSYLTYVISTFPAGDLTENRADIAIVLGAAVTNDGPSPVFEERIKHAINLYKAGNVSKLMFTGGFGESKQLAESLIARDYAIKQSVSVGDIYTEILSHTTKQNLLQAKDLLIREGFKKSIIVSDPLHMTRAMMMAKDVGLNAIPSATTTSRYKSLRTKVPFILREIYFYHHYLMFSK